MVFVLMVQNKKASHRDWTFVIFGLKKSEQGERLADQFEREVPLPQSDKV